MANKIIGITVDIEGKSSGLTKSLQEANAAINKTTSALKDVDKALQLDPTNVELLAQKEVLLNKQIEQTNEKLEIMQQVAEDANEALARGDISQEQYASLQAEIAKTSVSLEDLEDAANDSGEELEETGEEAEDSGEAMEAFGEAAEKAGEMAVAAFEAVVAAAAAVGAAIVGAMAAAGSALVNATVDTAHLADELLTMSSTTGLATDTLQELNYASELLDVDTQTVTGSMTKLLRTMSSADSGSSAALESFEALGISIYDMDGNLRSTEDVFWDAIDALGQFDNETERDAASMDLFGKSARELNPLIEAGSEAFAELADEAHEVGYVMNGETLDAFGALDDNMVRMENTAQAVEQSFGQVLLPLLTDMSGDVVDLMGDFSGALAGAGGDVDKMASIIQDFAPRAVKIVEQYFPEIIKVVESVFSALLPVIIEVAPQLIELIGTLIEELATAISQNSDSFISAFTTLFQSLVDSVAVLLPVIIPLAIELIMALVNGLVENAPLLIDGALQIIDVLVNTILAPENIEQFITGAATLITALLNGLTQAIPTLIPAAINAIMTIVDTLLEGGQLEMILNAALTLINTLAIGLIQHLPDLIAKLPEIIIGIVGFLTGDALPDLIEAGFTLITAIVGNLPAIIAAIVEALIELVAGMIEYIVGDGKDDLMKNFEAVFMGIAEGAKTWGSDVIQLFIDGIKAMWENLKNTLNSVAELVKSILGFSVPEEGPLHEWAINNPGEDMLKLYSEGIERGMTDFENTLYNTANAINRDITGLDMSSDIMVNRSTDFSSFAEAFLASNSASMIFPIYIGSEHVDTIIMDATRKYNYISGGY